MAVYITKNKNEYGVSMVLETFRDDDNLFGFYWSGDNQKWGISDCGTKFEVIRRLQNLICLCEQQIAVCKAKGYTMLQNSEKKEIQIYRELIGALENM
jgi:hypothetical protein